MPDSRQVKIRHITRGFIFNNFQNRTFHHLGIQGMTLGHPLLLEERHKSKHTPVTIHIYPYSSRVNLYKVNRYCRSMRSVMPGCWP